MLRMRFEAQRIRRLRRLHPNSLFLHQIRHFLQLLFVYWPAHTPDLWGFVHYSASLVFFARINPILLRRNDGIHTRRLKRQLEAYFYLLHAFGRGVVAVGLDDFVLIFNTRTLSNEIFSFELFYYARKNYHAEAEIIDVLEKLLVI